MEAKEEKVSPAPGSLFDPASVGQRVDYAVGHVIAEAPKAERARWESWLSGTARNSIKTAVGVWYGGRALSDYTFRQLLLDPHASDETADQFRSAAKGIVEARDYAQLGDAGSHLATAVLNVGVDAWPQRLGDLDRRALAAVSERAIPEVIKVSTDGLDMPRAIGAGIIVGGIILYLRQKQEEAARQGGSKPTGPKSPQQPTIVEAAVPLPLPKDGETPTEVLKPGGQNVGDQGSNSGIRVLPGGEEGARELFDRLTKGKGGVDITPKGHPGQVIKLPDGSTIGHRPTSKSGPPTIDTNVPGLSVRELKFPGGSGR